MHWVEVSPQYDFLISDMEKYLFLTCCYPGGITPPFNEGQSLWTPFLLTLKDFSLCLYLQFLIASSSSFLNKSHQHTNLFNCLPGEICHHYLWRPLSLLVFLPSFTVKILLRVVHIIVSNLHTLIHSSNYCDLPSVPTTPLNCVIRSHKQLACCPIHWYFSIYLLLDLLASQQHSSLI